LLFQFFYGLEQFRRKKEKEISIDTIRLEFEFSVTFQPCDLGRLGFFKCVSKKYFVWYTLLCAAANEKQKSFRGYVLANFESQYSLL
jgi:hypothetical protein